MKCVGDEVNAKFHRVNAAGQPYGKFDFYGKRGFYPLYRKLIVDQILPSANRNQPT